MSSCICTTMRAPGPMVITDGSAVRVSARISARAPPDDGIGKGAVPRRVPCHSTTAAYPVVSPVGSPVKRARPAPSLLPCRTSILLLWSIMPSSTAWFPMGAPVSSRTRTSSVPAGSAASAVATPAVAPRTKGAARRRGRRRSRRPSARRGAARRRCAARRRQIGDQHGPQSPFGREREGLRREDLLADRDLRAKFVAGDHPFEEHAAPAVGLLGAPAHVAAGVLDEDAHLDARHRVGRELARHPHAHRPDRHAQIRQRPADDLGQVGHAGTRAGTHARLRARHRGPDGDGDQSEESRAPHFLQN